MPRAVIGEPHEGSRRRPSDPRRPPRPMSAKSLGGVSCTSIGGSEFEAVDLDEGKRSTLLYLHGVPEFATTLLPLMCLLRTPSVHHLDAGFSPRIWPENSPEAHGEDSMSGLDSPLGGDPGNDDERRSGGGYGAATGGMGASPSPKFVRPRTAPSRRSQQGSLAQPCAHQFAHCFLLISLSFPSQLPLIHPRYR